MFSLMNNGTTASAKLPLIAPGSELSILLINVVYLAFVFKIGPRLMRNREPFNLKSVLLVYNLFQIFACAYMFIEGVRFVLQFNDLGCMETMPEDSPNKFLELKLSYMYYIIKYIDYFDTICFVLRKSYKQVTFLHVYHHITMSLGAAVYLRSYGWGGHSTVTATLNSVVHVVMYTYYLISALRSNVKNSLRWKKHITQLQFVQFVLMLVHQAWPLLFRPDCGFPKVWNYIAVLQALAMIFLFGNFYRKAYLQKSEKKGSDIKTK